MFSSRIKYLFLILFTTLTILFSTQSEINQVTADSADTLGMVRIKDINTYTASSYAYGYTEAGADAYFFANYPHELWKTDGTTAGTIRIKAEVGSYQDGTVQPAFTTYSNDTFFFTFGRWFLWQSDGTEAGTFSIDIGQRFLDQLVPMDNIVYFGTTAISDSSAELWRSDGTQAGTTMVKAFLTNGFFMRNLTVLDNILYFSADDGTNGIELWRSDGTEAGTMMVKDINPTGSALRYDQSPMNFLAADGWLYFSADNGSGGTELWRSDGTEAGTMMVKDIHPGVDASTPFDFIFSHGYLYFKADDGVNGAELWRSDGTEAGTTLVADIYAGAAGANPSNLIAINDTLFFAATDAIYGRELWRLNLPDGQPEFVKDVEPGAEGAFRDYYAQNYLGQLGNQLVFAIYANNNGYGGHDLWVSDGTAVNTTPLGFVNHQDSNAVANWTPAFGDKLLFMSGGDHNDYEPWISDGTVSGTHLLADINQNSLPSEPDFLTNVDGTLFFRANDGAHGAELWRSDGTEANTVMVKDIDPSLEGPGGPHGTGIKEMMAINQSAFFTTYAELWTSDGSEVGTIKLQENLTSPKNLTNLDGTLLFSAQSSTALWRSDGTVVGTVEVKSFSAALEELTAVSPYLFFTTGNKSELWRSDGTEAGTIKLADYGNGGVERFAELTNFNGTLYFRAYQHPNGEELWQSDGTVAGTMMVTNINPTNSFDTGPENLTVVGNKLFFSLLDQLWQSDGTAAGTSLLKDFNLSNPYSNNFSHLVDVNGTLFFFNEGKELWKSDGTVAGTLLITTFIDRTISQFSELAAFSGELFFTFGDELWRSDGTPGGTYLYADKRWVAELTPIGNQLFFEGGELWAIQALPNEVNIGAAAVNASEDGLLSHYQISLTTQPSSDVTITLTTDGQTAVSSDTLVFNSGNWTLGQSVTVTAVDDNLLEGLHSSTISHIATSGDPAYNGIPIGDAIINIIDNDEGLFLPIISVANEAVQLNWPSVTDVNRYDIYRSDSNPYFIPGTPFDTTTSISWEDDQALETGSYFYGVTAVTQSGTEIQSPHTGLFKFPIESGS